MKYLVFASVFFLTTLVYSQELMANQILDNAIKYHDPNNKWSTFKGDFTVVMTTPNNSDRTSEIKINLQQEFFSVNAHRDTVTTFYSIDKGICKMKYNGKVLDSIQAKDKNLSCERAELYKNYYTYLYGLPMKLKDPGTNLDNTVEKKSFKGKDYLVLKVSYDESVGSDVWYFYFNPRTYAMEIYQFYKTDKNGKVKFDSGEYILLSEEATVNDIKMPKIRAWYYNKDDKYLGTDTLINN
ncbi:DUF6503 family protein [Winogradskyella vincentii]|uniref:DUF6503 family protein n=1 Tax=Winogradskyella vincentii TaxID=2877122 RepID=A0ABS7XY70_9FLAO|nr:DUF6503 family protein [Winogradskyella vincentii]MCA0152613.1 DUF6503 family protein [Winogradskyella vincentii]